MSRYREVAMKRFLFVFAVLVLSVGWMGTVEAATQDKYDLPEPYLAWEKAYLKEFPQLQGIMDVMIQTTISQMKEPKEDILHNRVCSAIAYWLAKEQKMPKEAQRLAVIGDLLHNINKEEKEAVLTNPDLMNQANLMVKKLKGSGYFKNSPKFWADEAVLKNPKIGNNRALIHHITGAIQTGQILKQLGGISEKDVEAIQAAIIEHSTGYWYFRASIDDVVGYKGAWEIVFPEPETDLSKFVHDADLISQFVPESVTPEGSKWRGLAQKRWGAKNTVEEAHIVYYVFFRLFEEAKTKPGKDLALEQWKKIRPELIKLMNLKPDQDPIKILGVPKIFQQG
jgi:hypothetical protein